MKIKLNIKSITCGVSFLLLFITGCKKTDVNPGNGQDAYINFFNASEVLQQNIALALNNTVVSEQIRKDKFPMAFQTDGDNRQFPFAASIGTLPSDNLSLPTGGINYTNIYWLPVKTGTYSLGYTSDSSYIVIKDTTINLASKSFTTQYLVESPVDDTAYNILTVPTERAGTPGKVRLQFIHLSPDLSNLDIARIDANGNEMPDALPKKFAYGSYTNYIELDTAGAASTRGQIILNFRKSGSTRTALSAAIPAASNSSFTVLIQGFEHTTARRIRMRDGYRSVSVNPNLRINLRRIF